jgi:hypothetical protein
VRGAWFLLIAVTSAAQTAGTNQTGSVSGIVTDAVTHIPIKKAMVSINAMNIAQNAGPQATTTDASGAFSIANLQAGRYRLAFVHEKYPQARFGGVGKTVDIKAGESAGPIAVELMPGAALSGHVVDEDGDPMPNCYVQIHPAKNPEEGVQMGGSSGSNPEGEYRMFGIAPGKYILAAQCGQQAFQARPFSAGPDPPPSRAYRTQYYPLASEAKSAQVVELTGGNEKSGIDFQMSPVGVTQVRGTFSPGGADWHNLKQFILQLNPVDQPGMGVGGAHDLEKGTFDFRQVFPGSYILSAFSQSDDENRIGAWRRIDVGDKPVELSLELRHAIDLTGKVEIETSANTTNKLTPSQIHIGLNPQSQGGGLPGSQTQVNEDGTFTIKGVLPAPWRLQLNAPFAFVKAAWLGSTDVTNGPFDLSSGAAGAIRILVSTNTATIRGSAPAGMMVFVRRADQDPVFGGQTATGVDQNGQYTLGGLAPGKYRVFVMDPGEAPPDDGGQGVTVREGETVMVDLKAPSSN